MAQVGSVRALRATSDVRVVFVLFVVGRLVSVCVCAMLRLVG